MGFTQAIGHCFSHYADFNGRARRSEYWFWYLFTTLVMIVGLVVLSASIEPKSPSPVPGFVLMGLGLFFLATALPGLAVTVRRLHDTGKSGWWILLGMIPGGPVVLVVFMLLDSQPGDNRFGPSPKGGGGRRVSAGFPAEPEDNWSTRLASNMATRQPGPAQPAPAYNRNPRPAGFGQRPAFGQRQRSPG